MHIVVLLLALAASAWLPVGALLPAQSATPSLSAEADRLFETLALREGMTAGEIGAGAGELTVLIAKRLGPQGSVHSTDINADRLSKIRKAVEAAKLQNVRVIEGGTVTTNLPDGCCDAIFMRSVYHHFEDPVAMNVSILVQTQDDGPGRLFLVLLRKPGAMP
ncbi:MAG: class I SAM-dependent methyltransferase [Acidobacteria bacterium]|nr:class I SAM-dependent methyltransferase [Acidobacteriota bacterium]